MCLCCNCLGALQLSQELTEGYSTKQRMYFTYWEKRYYF